MVLITNSGPETLPIGKSGPDFSLPGTDGKTYSLSSFSAAKAVVISFTCNHCPYAQAYEGRFSELARAYGPKGVAFVAISANDAETYPEDSFSEMKKRAAHFKFPFPYLYDETQDVARAYGAVCTPHLFLLDGKRNLAYEGRIDDNWQNAAAAKAHDLNDGIEAVLQGRAVPNPNTNPMGCSIKWKGTGRR